MDSIIIQKLDANKSWGNPKNVIKIYPPNYKKGGGSGFTPGEKIPKQVIKYDG